MPELTREEKLKLVEKLPKQLQEFLYSEDTGAFLLYLGEKYNLSDEKVSALSKLVGDVVLGITSLPNLISEIVSGLAIDSSVASQIVQEINTELFAPVSNLLKGAPMPAPVFQFAPPPTLKPAMPSAPPVMSIPSPKSQVPSSIPADRYREPTTEGPARQRPEPQALAGGPEVVDLRKTPPPPIQMPVTAAPIPPAVNKIEPPAQTANRLEPLPINLRDFSASPAPAPTPLPRPAAKPLTFTKPIEKTPLIEAEPHLSGKISPEISAGETPPAVPPVFEPRPQFIIRPPGLSPTDLPRDVLDLRKDKGEF